METTNLPVKYRPRILEDFVGQERVVSDLKSMFKRGRLPSSFLLTGPTGTGKTTLSRIIARYVNCSSPDSKTLQPCGECACCKMETPPDFIEVNAADARGIDDVRSLIQQSKNMPSLGRKRFIMLDEAHMLTSQSQNCFSPDTLVHTLSGTAQISELSVGDLVASYDFSKGTVEYMPVEATSTHSTEKECVRVYVSDSQYIDCTADHRFWSVTRNAWIAAGDLQAGEDVKPLFGGTYAMKVQRVVPIEKLSIVVDIQVVKNNNFYVGAGVLVHNCLLKGLEEPSPNTVWIVSSMNHEKLLPAIAGRCTHLAMRPVSKEDMLPRLRRIARKEGVDFKKIEGADKVLDQLCDMSYGHMRNAVELLDRVISQASSGKVTADSLSAALSSTPDADYEEAAARVFAAVLQKDLKAFLASVAQIDNFRTLLFKMRWLLDYLLQNSVGAAKFTPKSAKLLSQMLRKDGTKLSLTKALDAQRSLVEIELRMNTVSIDERILFTTMMYDALKG